MKMNKKGFTLIELLAVIVILAIIALIATPIVMNIINNATEQSKARSLEKYVSQLELGYANAILSDADATDAAKQTTAWTWAQDNTNGDKPANDDTTGLVWGNGVETSGDDTNDTAIGAVHQYSATVGGVELCYNAGAGAVVGACS